MQKGKKVRAKCPEISKKLELILDIRDFRLIERIRKDFPFAEIIVKTQDGYPMMIERAITKVSLNEPRNNG